MDFHQSSNPFHFSASDMQHHSSNLTSVSHPQTGSFGHLDSSMGVFMPQPHLPTSHSHPGVSLFTAPSSTLMGSAPVHAQPVMSSAPLHAESTNCGGLPSGYNTNFGTTMNDYRGISNVTYGSPTHSIDISGQGMYITPETASTFTTKEYFCPLGPTGPTITNSYTGYGPR
jgi:hypothetical protein